MKPLERDSLILLAMAERALVEHMLRLWMSRVPDDRHPEDRAKLAYAAYCQDMFSFGVRTAQLAYFYEGGFDLTGFVTWWRIGPETLAAFKAAAADGLNLGGTLPLDPRTVMLKRPEAVYIQALVTKPGRTSVAKALARAIQAGNRDCKRFFWWDRRRTRLVDWSGNSCR